MSQPTLGSSWTAAAAHISVPTKLPSSTFGDLVQRILGNPVGTAPQFTLYIFWAHPSIELDICIEQMPIGHDKTSTMCSATSRTHCNFPIVMVNAWPGCPDQKTGIGTPRGRPHLQIAPVPEDKSLHLMDP
ncbi:unnamed protein product [Fusarium venenatum]|uniref:Uncharacterized protein n=1 Tax=Fusarium venenatum TaxID=56646 RepID=A0A2L2TMH9_9HYPO|nr:uncharacterized protein FVRRES_03323 [Fusarium venenatum]CEI66811.1 unnamed protein product [Fusarium venenatum]